MPDLSTPYSHIGRATPAQGVKFPADGPTILWMTVCSKDRGEWMATKQVMDALHDIRLNKTQAWLVGDYLLMPDHVHFFCAPRELQFTVEQWVKFWKSEFSRGHDNAHWNWQRSGFHHRIRNGQEYSDKWIYMMENPMRKGFVQKMEDWPWRGRVHDVGWK